ncbi:MULTISPECIES: ferredoxin reductase [unclassified Pseudomonas]|uniref:ferredoxin reductase n=1 Tax=unclassified Pseudomonas TaxID=196821 RepID=UPI000ECA10D2|nr:MULTISPECIES: ferredoxin reductase [unclassified Pseudomonas]HBZ95421.1 ferredoxin reductase [Pseudomonas sp.]
MALLSLSGARWVAGCLWPLRQLCSGGWLREADVDLCLRQLHPTLRLNRVFAQVEARRWVAEDMLALKLCCNGNAQDWRAGQHVQLYLEQNGVRHGRSYSLTSVAADGRIEIAIKRQPDGRLSNLLLDDLAVGQVIELGRAFGDFAWPQEQGSVLLLAAGSGITPLLGLLRDALARGFAAPVTLLHQVRRQGQQAFAEELQALAARHANVQVQWVFSGEGDRLSAERLAALPGDHLRVCGPRGFVEQACGWWHGARRGSSLQSESFSPLPMLADVEDREVRLSFARSRQQVSGSSNASLLEQAEAAGLRPAHGCRQGICTSCTCLLLAGSVRDLRSGELFAEPHQPIRLCVSAPHGDVEIDL